MKLPPLYLAYICALLFLNGCATTVATILAWRAREDGGTYRETRAEMEGIMNP